jgi:MFS family permease
MRRLLLVVTAIVFVETMFYSALTPLLPYFVERFDLSKSGAGILSAAYAAGSVTGSLPGGFCAARFGVKVTVLVGLTLMASTGLTFAFADDVVTLDIARFLQGVGGAFTWSAGLAWLIGGSPPERRGELVGWGMVATITGLLCGPLIGSAATVTAPEPVFAGVAVAIAAIATWAWLTPSAPAAVDTGPRRLIRTALSRGIVVALWLVTLPAMFSGVINVLVPLHLHELGASGAAIGAVFLVAAAIQSVSNRVFGRMSDRRGRLVPIRAGLVAVGVMSVVLPLMRDRLLVSAAVILAVVCLSMFWSPAIALLSDAAAEARLDQGFAFALVNLAWATGQIIGGSGGGRLADLVSDQAPYLAVSALCAMTAAVLAASAASTPRRRPRASTE